MNKEYSANDLVPEEYQMRLMMWRDEFTRGYFEIGDIANEIVVYNIQQGMKIDQNSIYSAVGKFCGKSGRTVRDYAEVAAFFSPGVRDEYDVLPFSHFRFAKSCGLDYREALDRSLSNPSMSVEALELLFRRHPDSSVDTTGFVGEFEPGVSFPVAPPTMGEVYALANLIAQSERLLSWDIDRKVREELMVALDSLKHVLAQLSSGGVLFADDEHRTGVGVVVSKRVADCLDI